MLGYNLKHRKAGRVLIFAADIDCPLYLEQSEHIKYQENTKGPSRNVSFYIKFSVLEVGHTQAKTFIPTCNSWSSLLESDTSLLIKNGKPYSLCPLFVKS